MGSNNNAGTGATLQLTPSMGAPGDSIVCTVDVADGYGGSAVDTATATISNTDPVISDVNINYSGDLTSTTSLTCDYTATDADNQTLAPAYAWTNLSTNTAFTSTASTLQLTPSSIYYWCPETIGNWYEAQEHCEAAEMNLITINSPQENTEVRNLVEQTNGSGKHFYIGLNDIGNSGNYTWVDGSTVSYTNWTSTEPDGNGDCGYTRPNLEWWDGNCYNPVSFVCE